MSKNSKTPEQRIAVVYLWFVSVNAAMAFLGATWMWEFVVGHGGGQVSSTILAFVLLVPTIFLTLGIGRAIYALARG